MPLGKIIAASVILFVMVIAITSVGAADYVGNPASFSNRYPIESMSGTAKEGGLYPTAYYPEDPKGASVTIINYYDHTVDLGDVTIGFYVGQEKVHYMKVSGHQILPAGGWAIIHNKNIHDKERRVWDITLTYPEGGMIRRSLWIMWSVEMRQAMSTIGTCDYFARKRVFADEGGYYFTNQSSIKRTLFTPNEYSGDQGAAIVQNFC